MIGERLKEIREKHGMNKKEFSNYIGIKYTTYNGYETEAREPDSDFLILISQKFNVSTDYLLGLQGDKEVLYSYKLKSTEFAHIEKYRLLDPHGKDMVDTVLTKEYDRCQEKNTADSANIIQLKDSDRSYLDPVAAHDRPDQEMTDEMNQEDHSIMSNDDEWK